MRLLWKEEQTGQCSHGVEQAGSGVQVKVGKSQEVQGTRLQVVRDA